MTVAIVDYGSGNLHSAEKAFQRMSREGTGEAITVTADPEIVRRADRIVLPGVGAYADCRAGLDAAPGMVEALEERAHRGGAPFLGICVGMQLMATVGREFQDTAGLDWIPGEVVKLRPDDDRLKVPHMGWNELIFGAHPLFEGIAEGAHAYFVHSYQFRPRDPALRLAHVAYGEMVTAAVGRDNLAGTQFHPEKSQETGLRLIANFLAWSP
ncbi:imidazole glycerol phosphate synthase subunit HisH [Pikeienuella piscinae]|uniref:Imidazole glycerol phosphate synthase subunit HisH n=1 Tax=Pikeienuella piscinae TaxID=2748098 RepID=A0A7L5BZM4_9RHOB|nr:imidazole glycerol phosphate synthase subunit HisH [Pikeienuella piscinae]QIE56931.1 imidazole glycerol phosphate synthase subunit HisH [Pikeienuella piscinae]